MNQSRKIVAISLYQSTAGEILQDILALGDLDEKLYLRLYPSVSRSLILCILLYLLCLIWDLIIFTEKDKFCLPYATIMLL